MMKRNHKPSTVRTQHLNFNLYSLSSILIPVSIRNNKWFMGRIKDYLIFMTIRGG
jgi:hypothetical protein